MSVLARAWRLWIKFAEVLGNVQMIILLSVIYWTFVAVIAITFKLLSDPLALRRSSGPRWVTRRSPADFLESMRKQG